MNSIVIQDVIYCLKSEVLSNDEATIGAATAASNPVTIGSAIHLVTELCEQC